MSKPFHTGPLTLTVNSKVIECKSSEIHTSPTVVVHGTGGGGINRGSSVPVKSLWILVAKDQLNLQEWAWAAGVGTSPIVAGASNGSLTLTVDASKRDCPEYDNVRAEFTTDNGETWTFDVGRAEVVPPGEVILSLAEAAAAEFSYAVHMVAPAAGVVPLKVTVSGITQGQNT